MARSRTQEGSVRPLQASKSRSNQSKAPRQIAREGSPETDLEHFPFCALPEHYFERATSSAFTASASFPPDSSLSEHVRFGALESADLGSSSPNSYPPGTSPSSSPRSVGLSLQRWSLPTTFGK